MPAIHYSLSTFLLHTPPDLLRAYLARRELLEGVAFEGLKRRAAARVVASALAELPEADRVPVEADFRNLALAARAGTSALCDVLGVRGRIAEADALAALENDHARALRLLLDHDQDGLFGEVLHFAQARSLPAGRFHRRSGLPHVAPRTDAEALAGLSAGLCAHFRTQRRGYRFEVSHSARRFPNRHWFLGVGEDHQQAEVEFDDVGLTCVPRRPAFEVAYMWHPDEGLLEIAAPGDRRDVSQLADLFRAAVLPGVDFGGNDRSIALHQVLDPQFCYPTDPKDGVRAIEPVKFRFTEGRRNGAALDVQRGPNESLHAFAGRVVNFEALQRQGLSLYSARIRAVWRPEAKCGTSTTFTLTMPDSTDLDDAPKHQILRGYLRRWGLAA